MPPCLHSFIVGHEALCTLEKHFVELHPWPLFFGFGLFCFASLLSVEYVTDNSSPVEFRASLAVRNVRDGAKC